MSFDGVMRTMANRPALAAQFGVRFAAVAGAAVALVAASRVDDAVPRLVTVGVLACAVIAAVVPDTHIGAVAIVWFAWYWLVRVDDRDNAWVLVAALGWALFHTAIALAALGPAGTPITAAIVARWLVRLVPVAAATAAVWAVSAAMVGTHSRPSALLLGAALVLVAGVVGVLSSRSRTGT